MREICTSGSVRGEGGNILTYSAVLPPQRCEMGGEDYPVAQAVEVTKEGQPARGVSLGSPVRKSRRNRRDNTRTGNRKPGRQGTQRVPSSEIPPPGTIMWTCG